jgi:FixJ family two-component response regulator
VILPRFIWRIRVQFLAKPFHFVDLIAAIEKALSSKRFG